VLAILPTATENLLDAVPVEQVLEELQKQKAQRLARSVGPSEIASSAPPSVADAAEDDAKSSSFQSEGYVHASQMAGDADGESVATAGSAQGSTAPGERKSTRSKAQLWSEMKISCEPRPCVLRTR
jgi:peroxin-3